MKLSFLVCMAQLALVTSAGAAELVLAEGGRTAYRVVGVSKPTELEFAAAADLKSTLKEITGADFGSDETKTKNIYIGIQPECDKAPLKEYERRITSSNGDIYIYGEGSRGNVFAVYDFLRDVLGCRWYTVVGDKKILKHERLVLPELKKSLIPSIPMMTASYVAVLPTWADFSRRIGLYDRADRDVCIGPYGIHAGMSIIPSGLIPFGGRIGNTFGPHEYFKDCAYFKDHPEYFSMNAKGERVVTMQLCYSNKGMRDQFESNILRMLNQANYRDERIIVGFGQNDNGGKFCYCKECEALEKKYQHPAGAYYDFLLDMSARFAKTCPKMLLGFLAYREDQTLRPSPLMKKLPENLLPSYAPLGCDFSKPLADPVNRSQQENFRRWSDIATRMHWWAYPTTYPRPVINFPLVANIHRIAENFRLAYKNKVWMAYCEFGNGPYGRWGFNDLRLYLLNEMCRRIDADEQAIIKEFAEACFGPAAPMYQKYLAELEELEAKYPQFLRWNPNILTIDYATPANLLRWQRDFDQMEKLAAGNKRYMSNLRCLRYNLDVMTVAKWPYMTKEEQAGFGDLEKLIARINDTIQFEAEELRESLRLTDPKDFAEKVGIRTRHQHFGADIYIARARGGKPLPKTLRKFEKTAYRIMPNRNKLGLDKDPAAPFGLCNTGSYPNPNTLSWVTMRTFVSTRTPQWEIKPTASRFNEKRIIRNKTFDGKYHYYYLGAMPILPDSQIYYGPISGQSGFEMGQLHDPKRPNRLYDFYVCLAVDPDKKWVKLGELVVIPLDKDAAPAKLSKPAKDAEKTKVDAFI